MNPSLALIPPSLIRSINARKRAGDLDFGLGEPTMRPDMAPFEAAVEWVREHGCPYTPNAGLEELRAQVAAYHARSVQPVRAENVCVTVGSEEALYLAIKAALDPARDEVLIVEPCYLAYAKLCVLEGVRHRMVPLRAADGFRPSAATVLEALGPATRMVILNSPCNPTGRVWPEEELRALARGLESRSGPPVYVLSDEVYRELYYGSEPPPSIAWWYPHALVAGSLSKSNALTGLRLGWLTGPADAIQGAVKAHQFVNTSASTLSQRVAIEIFGNPERLGVHRPAYARARELLLAAAAEHGVPLLPPEGAFYSLLRLPNGSPARSVATAERLLEEQRVVAIPGLAFGESGEGWLRLSWVAPDEVLVEGMRRIGEFLGRSPAFTGP